MNASAAPPDKDALRELFNRAVTDQIAMADRALSVAEAISRSAPVGHFGGLLYHLMTTQAEVVVLALSRMFDPPSKRYLTRSIPSLLKLLARHAAGIRVYRREALQSFVRAGSPGTELSQLSDSELTRAFVAAYEALLVEDGLSPSTDPPAVFMRIRTRRDKQVAHNEDWRPPLDEVVSWEDLRRLLNEAKSFARIVGPAYLDFHFAADDGTYMLTKSSAMIGRQAERLLKAAAEWIAQRKSE